MGLSRLGGLWGGVGWGGVRFQLGRAEGRTGRRGVRGGAWIRFSCLPRGLCRRLGPILCLLWGFSVNIWLRDGHGVTSLAWLGSDSGPGPPGVKAFSLSPLLCKTEAEKQDSEWGEQEERVD